MTTDDKGLLNCPFCGGEASPDGVIRYSDSHVREQEWGQNEFYYCNCVRCGVSNRGLIGYRSQADAIAAWNRRPSPVLSAEDAALVERLDATQAVEILERNIVAGDIDDDTAVFIVAGLIGELMQLAPLRSRNGADAGAVEARVERNEPGHVDSGGRVVVDFANDDEMRRVLDALATPQETGVPAGTTKAAQDVLAERHRQIEAEGWTPEHDDIHDKGEMAAAAVCYAFTAVRSPHHINNLIWPWASEWWKPTDARRNLVKAAALIIAEIERLDRLPAAPSKNGGEKRIRAALTTPQAPAPASGDLHQRCVELQEWWSTGLLRSGSRLEALAQEKFTQCGDDRIRQAEQATLRELVWLYASGAGAPDWDKAVEAAFRVNHHPLAESSETERGKLLAALRAAAPHLGVREG